MVQCDAIRQYAPGYPAESGFPDDVTQLIDDERRAQFTQEGSHLETEYFFSLTYQPPLEKEERIKGYLFESEHGDTASVAERIVAYFKDKIASFEAMFIPLLRARRLGAVIEQDELGNDFAFDEQLRYIRRTVQGEDYKFALPEFAVYLHDWIGAIDFLAGIEPQLGNKFLGIVAIDTFPSHSSPGILSGLNALPFEYRFNTRGILLDPEDSKPLLKSRFKKWSGMERGFLSQLLGIQKKNPDGYARLMKEDAAAAISVASAGDVQFLHYSANVIVLHERMDVLKEQLGHIAKVLKNSGFGARIESLNTVEAWRGSLPGDGYRNPRRFLIHTLNLVDTLPITAI